MGIAEHVRACDTHRVCPRERDGERFSGGRSADGIEDANSLMGIRRREGDGDRRYFLDWARGWRRVRHSYTMGEATNHEE